ncbi:unnamed protein product [Paramecium octaurelia]|uniref:Nuclear transcription factor Y subunit n=1 Tax=Paramecium octaurelia TaxID=43137 RepID=A0A8S1SDZ1_PAROT|nr:unnamed protein product [Paramecium octaurelia]
MLQENQRENEKKQYSMFYPEDERSKSHFLNQQYLTNFFEFTNHYKEPDLQNQGKQEEKNQHKIPIIIQYEQEPRYVNQKQYRRIMIRRIKRAQQALKLEELRTKQATKVLDKSNQKYIYESRHQHALKRERGPDGKFLKKQNSVDSPSKL